MPKTQARLIALHLREEFHGGRFFLTLVASARERCGAGREPRGCTGAARASGCPRRPQTRYSVRRKWFIVIIFTSRFKGLARKIFESQPGA
jgi:hypothetical protein